MDTHSDEPLPEPSTAETMDFVYDMLTELAEMSYKCGEVKVAGLLKLIVAGRAAPEEIVCH